YEVPRREEGLDQRLGRPCEGGTRSRAQERYIKEEFRSRAARVCAAAERKARDFHLSASCGHVHQVLPAGCQIG
ncbi:hypothetical protein LTR73_009388, partial [Friedmanniomyces endolithicus]